MGKWMGLFEFTFAGPRAELERLPFLPKETLAPKVVVEPGDDGFNRSLPEKLKVQLEDPRNATKRLPGLHRGVYK